MPVEQTLGPRVDSLAERISQACLEASVKRDTKAIVEANQCRLALLVRVGTIHDTTVMNGAPAGDFFEARLTAQQQQRDIATTTCPMPMYLRSGTVAGTLLGIDAIVVVELSSADNWPVAARWLSFATHGVTPFFRVLLTSKCVWQGRVPRVTANPLLTHKHPCPPFLLSS